MHCSSRRMVYDHIKNGKTFPGISIQVNKIKNLCVQFEENIMSWNLPCVQLVPIALLDSRTNSFYTYKICKRKTTLPTLVHGVEFARTWSKTAGYRVTWSLLLGKGSSVSNRLCKY